MPIELNGIDLNYYRLLLLLLLLLVLVLHRFGLRWGIICELENLFF
jgi:hypothetical protein